jgi:DNA-binding transcriptional MerR regulator
MSDVMPIGGLSRKTGVKVPTIRYYESIGLLPQPPRSEGNRRLYGSKGVERLRFIRHARELGFEVDAIRELLELADQPQRSCAKVDHRHPLPSRALPAPRALRSAALMTLGFIA